MTIVTGFRTAASNPGLSEMSHWDLWSPEQEVKLGWSGMITDS